ncbi:cysteine/serine-rich nuclear protein 1 isoform X1 [Crotalus tigris]|uniref:cysteine/serine-rich nuclear protein 1 isoform X1 n=2 Tax=Crotalus tigris TaxID=88082 RepID=UPI00192F7390|nr:cysteine/serine-rich nuclear protein 1 isoform X1 [Crotalus tigris]XP_039211186.1 cysteine/serine-rich nuclear protein 1 isoform X1 [Crotalus tigris]XP_039211187.1 cysteine/serine-rich nuclear protein 1 isoform X1 [Crotalus tigris]XP_039211188.1 cysteine/serine-rich nuclear protein 1 isoform X1 [Crotalus tigris]
MTGVLKRKHDELDDDLSYISSSSTSSPFSSSSALSGWESDEENSQVGLQPTLALNMDFTPTSILKKSKRLRRNNVEFDRVTVFYFPRCQGFTSVPSCGGCTLGMARKHGFSREFTMSEFCKQQQIVRREKLKDRLKEERLEALKLKLTMNGTKVSEEAKRLTIEDISVDDVDISNVDLENSFFLQPYTTKKRRALLKAMGVKKIDREEKRQLQRIRLSRENCGCDCQGFCDPETCSCSVAGIKCQMDYTSFPCGCTRDGCGNTEGRIEFNQARVQTHFLHTLRRLELEENQQNSESELPFRDHLHPFVYPVKKACYEERAVSLMPVFKFSTTLETVGENSCSSNTTDSSVSSNQSEDLEESYGTHPSEKSQLDIDDNGLARILHFNDSDAEEDSSGVGHCQDNLSSFHPSGFFSVDVEYQCATNPAGEMGSSSGFGYLSNITECLDENANQGPSDLLEEISIEQDEEGASFSPSSSEELDSKNYMDLSFSSDSLDFFQSFSDYNLGPLYNSLKEYENVDNFTVLQLQFPNLPSFSQPADQSSCFLESLIGLSESVPEIPAPFSDSQLLEDAIKSSLVETMKV